VGHPFLKFLDLQQHVCTYTNVSLSMQRKICLPAYFVLFISENFKLIQYRFISCSLWMRRWTQSGRKRWCHSLQLKSFSSTCDSYHKMRWDSQPQYSFSNNCVFCWLELLMPTPSIIIIVVRNCTEFPHIQIEVDWQAKLILTDFDGG
jgi:hypothetical protein